MSSAYSGATQYSAPVSTLDIAQLTTTVQSALQGRYDANVAKVDSLIQQYTSVPLVRAEDKQYLGERLQSMLTSIDQNAKINWTSGLATREVNARLAGAIDDNVLKQMSNSQAIINFEQTAAERKAGTADPNPTASAGRDSGRAVAGMPPVAPVCPLHPPRTD